MPLDAQKVTLVAAEVLTSYANVMCSTTPSIPSGGTNGQLGLGGTYGTYNRLQVGGAHGPRKEYLTTVSSIAEAVRVKYVAMAVVCHLDDREGLEWAPIPDVGRGGAAGHQTRHSRRSGIRMVRSTGSRRRVRTVTTSPSSPLGGGTS